VEVTSEENGYPIESALLRGEKLGWRAANAGAQIIRLSLRWSGRHQAMGFATNC